MSNFSQLALLVSIPVMIPFVPVHPVAIFPHATTVQINHIMPKFQTNQQTQAKRRGALAPIATSETGICLCHRASAYYDKGNYQQAAKYYSLAEAKMTKEYGANSPSVALMQYDQANCFYQMSNYKVAENMYSKSLSTYTKAPFPNHKDLAEVQWGLGNTRTASRSYDRAITAYAGAVSNFKSVGPSKEYANCLTAFADCYRRNGMQQKANELVAQAKEISRHATS